jgi:hypothetical protein
MQRGFLLMAEVYKHYIGQDGFKWWIGVVEDRNDPRALGRVRVRVFGHHTEDKSKIPTDALPWAWCVQPSTSGSVGGIGSSPTGPVEGTWVLGFWRDPDFMQEPMVLGTLPGNQPANNAPQGQAPYDYSLEQSTPPPEITETSYVADGTTTRFTTPIDTTDATVTVLVDGVVQSPSNTPPTSFTNVEVDTDGGTQYTARDFAPSRYATNIAAKINQISPVVRDRFANGVKRFLSNNFEDGYDCSISFSYRSLTEQASLYRRYQAGGPRAASPGASWHNYASAIDLTIYVNGVYDSGNRGVQNYTGKARAAFQPYGLVNEIENDSGHFYPVAFGKTPPTDVRNGTLTLAEYASEKGVA